MSQLLKHSVIRSKRHYSCPVDLYAETPLKPRQTTLAEWAQKEFCFVFFIPSRKPQSWKDCCYFLHLPVEIRVQARGKGGPNLFIFLLIALPARSGQHRRWRHQTLKHSLGFPSRRVTPITSTDHHRLNSLASQCKSINMEMVEEEVWWAGELPAGEQTGNKGNVGRCICSEKK